MHQVRSVRLGSRAVEVERRSDGTRIVRNREPLGPYAARLTDHLEHWAARAPERAFVAERDGEGWRRVTYAQALAAARAIGAALIDRGLTAERGVAILSENAVDHALLGLGALYAGVPYAPISTAYSLVSTDHRKLREVLAVVTPGLVYASDGAAYAAAIDAAVPPDAELVTSRAPHPARATTPFAALLAAEPGAALARAHAAVGPDTIAKILFTSGSTGTPKGVVNTHRMLCANQRMIQGFLAFLTDEPPVILDWLPWNHTFGGNHNVGIVLANGGTLYVNPGKPAPALFGETVRALREVAPTIYFDVPKGYELLIDALRRDPALAQRFFSRLRVLFYSGAGLSPHLWDALQELAVATTGERILMTTSLGSTETAPAALAAPWFAPGPGYVGVPIPGVTAKLVPVDGKLELRLRGDNITPGYFRDPVRTREAFDEDGFYRIGDALRFVDEARPEEGFFFDGRIAEDFKLATGTWVSAGPLRTRLVARFGGLLTDAVLSGPNRDEIVALAFVDPARARALATDVPADAPLAAVCASPALRAQLAAMLDALAAEATGSATRIARLLLLVEPPALDAGEITDKGSLNARTVLARRAQLADAAHEPHPGDAVIVARRAAGAAT
ncbi:MAG TPA: feruloyl-CoA synthase [Candidatus Sulfotelmatobacter sp.]|nr:feruloyl-CoA synthase [Candidatus Sulfotelmatobacter sp.]